MDDEKLNAWKWLGRARAIDREINALEEEKQDTIDALTRVTQNYESDGAQSTKDPHKFDRIAEYIDAINEHISELYDAKLEIIEVIHKLENGKQRTVLTNYYIRLMTLEATAAVMGISFRQTLRIRKTAVLNVERLLRENVNIL